MTRRFSSLPVLALVWGLLFGSTSIADPNPFVRQTTRQLSDAVSERVTHDQLAAKPKKAVADDMDASGSDFAAWYHFDLQGTSDDDFPLEIHANSYQPLVGLDYSTGSAYFGAAVGYQGIDAEFRISPALFGTFLKTEKVNADVATVAPYFALALGDHVSTSLVAGYQVQEWRRFSALIPRDLDSQVFFYDANVDVVGRIGEALEVRGNGSFTHEITKMSRTSTENDFTASAGLDLGIPMGSVTPYGRAWYEYSFEDGENDDGHTGFAGAGLRVAFSERVGLEIGGYTSFGHNHRTESGGQATLFFTIE